MRYHSAAFICSSSLLLIAAALVGGTGCNSSSRYDVVAPGSARGPIPRNAGTIVTRDKIDYEVFQADDKIIVRFVNRTGQPLKLTEQSVAIDAGGRSFAIEPQEVAADQSGRIVVPPAYAVDRTRTTPVATEVHVGGVDEGGIIGTRRDIENNDATGGAIGAAAAPPPGFRWPPNAQARLKLTFHVGDSTQDLSHDWSFRRLQ